MKKSKKPFAQNKIAYIVYSNPTATAALIEEYGYEAPQDPHQLVDVTKDLVKKKGIGVIKSLLQIHPDKKAILSLNQVEDSYCGCGQANYTGTDKAEYLESLSKLSLIELEKRYDTLKKKSSETPENATLSEEVQLVWNELRLRKKEEKPKKTKTYQIEKLVLLGAALIAGIVIGSMNKVSHAT